MGTTSTSVIASIGAVAFDRNWESFDKDSCAAFYVNVDIQDCLNRGLTVDGNTLQWWMCQSEEARLALFTPKPVTLHTGLDKLAKWVKDIGGRNIPCWTHATFDAPILGYAATKCGKNLHNITSFKCQRDIRTLNELKRFYKVERKGVHHNALGDALFQAEYIWGLLNNKGN